jgi:hypothetical protein
MLSAHCLVRLRAPRTKRDAAVAVCGRYNAAEVRISRVGATPRARPAPPGTRLQGRRVYSQNVPGAPKTSRVIAFDCMLP